MLAGDVYVHVICLLVLFDDVACSFNFSCSLKKRLSRFVCCVCCVSTFGVCVGCLVVLWRVLVLLFDSLLLVCVRFCLMLFPC